MNIKKYLDSTYLKTADQAGLTEQENLELVKKCIVEAIENHFKLVMIRPEHVTVAREMIDAANSEVVVGTVIDFPKGDGGLEAKLAQANQAIADGADELDFVVDYKGFIKGNSAQVKDEVLQATRLGLAKGKLVKWIIETAALTPMQIVQLSAMIKNCVIANFEESEYDKVFVKSSTGFYKTLNGTPNGATVEAIKLMVENAYPLPVKASGGVRNLEEAMQMIRLGVKRIGTSSAKAIADGAEGSADY